jgi:hypothetical protein
VPLQQLNAAQLQMLLRGLRFCRKQWRQQQQQEGAWHSSQMPMLLLLVVMQWAADVGCRLTSHH